MTEPKEENSMFLDQLTNQNPDSFLVLYDKYAPAIYGVILDIVKDPIIGSEVLHKVFEHAWLTIDQYNPGKLRLFTWLWQIARTLSIDAMQSRGKDEVVKVAGKIESGLHYLIDNLKEDDQYVIYLCYYKNLTAGQIAEELGISEEVASMKVLQAMKVLGEKMVCTIHRR